MIKHYTYEQLINSLEGRKATYQELLNTQEWKSFRETVLLKDKNRCTVCGTKKSKIIRNNHVREFTEEEIEKQKILDEIEFELHPQYLDIFDEKIKLKPAARIGEILDMPLYLHAHHNFYIFGKLPWEYNPSDLKSMCEKCHTKFHKVNTVAFYTDTYKNEQLNLTPCSRCSGAGFLYEYSHVQGGICFKCNGAKYEELIGKGIY